MVVTYNEVKEEFEKHNCKLLMTEEEFNLKKRRTNENYKYIASCKCNHEIRFTNFKYGLQGRNCPKHSHLKQSIDNKEKYKLNPILPSDLEKY